MTTQDSSGASWSQMSTHDTQEHLGVLMRIHECSGLLKGTHDSSWGILSGNLLATVINKNVNFAKISVQISPNNKNLDIFEMYMERAVEKCPRWIF